MINCRKLETLCACAVLLFGSVNQLKAEPWKFGLMGDTQWKSNLDGQNPNTVAAGIIRQINSEFIHHDVKFVIQVGDLVDQYSTQAFDTRADEADALLYAGIGFFPLRGNHEASSAAANHMSYAFPQVCGDVNTFGATNFSSPSVNLQCLSYSFDFNNVRIVMLDQFTRKDNTGFDANNNISDQLNWLTSTLSGRTPGTHAFVFSHKPLIAQNHVDVLTGANPSSNASVQNNFFRILAENNVRYSIGGHDHLHHRSIIYSPDRQFTLQELICSSNSYKFYTPATPSVDQRYNNPSRELPISQELYTIGFYIFTVDESHVTVDYYSSLNGCSNSWESLTDCDLKTTPQLSFVKRESYGYSLDGKEFIVKNGESLTVIKDTCKLANSLMTRAAVLNGSNATSCKLLDSRYTVQNACTGWKIRSEDEKSAGLASDRLRLWGMADKIGSNKSDTFALSMTYDSTVKGSFSLLCKDSAGKWIKAVNSNYSSGESHFVIGPFRQGYAAGTYGIDPATHSVWAVVDHDGEFAAVKGNDGDQDGDNDVDDNDISLVASLKNQPASVNPSADLDNDGRITILDARKLALIKNDK